MENTYPKISVITACLNSEKTVEQTIQSVISQSYRNIEYIVIDGGSVDRTGEIIAKYAGAIHRCVSEPDDGIYYAFNKGVSMATGDVIYFLNSDDYLYDADALSDVARVFAENPDLTVVYGRMKLVEEASGFFYFQGRELSVEDLKKGVMPPHPATFIKKSMYLKHGFFDVGYRSAADLDLFLRFYRSEDFRARFLDRVIAVFRQGGFSNNLKTYKIGHAETESIVRKHFGEVLVKEELRDRLLKFYKSWLFASLSGKAIAEALGPCERVAVFGSGKTAIFLKKDLDRAGKIVAAFLDNDRERQGLTLHGIPILPPSWLREHADRIGAVIISIEGDHDEQIREQVRRLAPGLGVYSWKELVAISQP